MPPQHDKGSLLKELQGHNVFFDAMVDMIPAKLYVAGNTGDDSYSTKYYKGQHKESKESRRARAKASKRAKFDPSLSETTRETKERLSKQESEEMEEETVAGERPAAAAVTEKKADATPSNKSRIEQLREKLQAKIAEKRAQRPHASDATISKRAARRAEKQRRQQEARNKASFSKAEKATKKSKQVPSSTTSIPSPMQDLEQLDFGKLAGLNPKLEGTNKSLAGLGGGKKAKNLEKMLKDAQEKKRKLEMYKQAGEEKQEQAQKMLWGDALKEASGERVKDDPAQIKKQLKRKAAKKQKSQKAWKSRMAATQSKMQERQTIRNHNLQQRKLGGATGANLSKKRIVMDSDDAGTGTKKKKRLSRAGFEGRKQGFLNNGGKE